MDTHGFWELEKLGRERLSQHFFMRDFLYSEIAGGFSLTNIPEDIDLAIENGRVLCSKLLEPIVSIFGPIQVRSGYRSPTINGFGAEHRLKCSSNEKNYAAHIWDKRDSNNRRGASACIVIPWCLDHLANQEDWKQLALFLHEQLDYDHMKFFTNQFAFNIGWREEPRRQIYGYSNPSGWLVSCNKINSSLAIDSRTGILTSSDEIKRKLYASREKFGATTKA